MNDFTKDELKLLGGCVFSKFISSLEDPSIQHLQPDLKKIRDKLESMINNYCDHDWQETAREKTYFICKKCDEEST